MNDHAAGTLILATMGPSGTNSETAALQYAHVRGVEAPELVFATVPGCLARVAEGRADLAVLPGENMVDGLIGPTFDALIEANPTVRILDELHLPIEHVLAAVKPIPAGAITHVYSHPSALNQCARHLAEIAPQAVLVPVGSTAEAAARVAADIHSWAAAVCPPEAARNSGLVVLHTGIGDYSRNQTRFLICGKGGTAASGDDLTWIAVRYGQNRPGQLYRAAGAIAERGVDLTSVHSRPYKIRPQEYVLLFELVGHIEEPPVAEAVREIARQAEDSSGWALILGSFPRRGWPWA